MDGPTIVIWLLIIYIIIKRVIKIKLLPPGPTGLPLFGNFLNLIWSCYQYQLSIHQVLSHWADRFGNVYSFTLGSQLVVVLNDVLAAEEAFTKGDITNRPVNKMLDSNKYLEGTGVLHGSGRIWKGQRELCMDVFRSLDKGTSSFENVIGREVDCLTSEFKTKTGSPFNPQSYFTKAAGNIMSSLVLGQRYAYTDETFNKVLKRLQRNSEIGSTGVGLPFFSILKYIPGISKLVDEYKSNLAKNIQFVSDVVEERRDTYDSNNLRNFVDACLQKLEMDENEASALSEKQLLATILDLFDAGTETTSTSLSWFVLYMVAHPEIQQRIQKDIDSVAGRDCLSKLSDKARLPYIEAVILEVLRIQTVTPLGVYHCADRNTYVQGHRVPKGSIVICNIWHMLHTSNVWEEPYKFNPQRFLDEDGKLKTNSDVMIPFGIGRRVCIGEQIAKTGLYIFITHLLHKFSFELPNGYDEVSFNGTDYMGVCGMINAPKPYQVIVKDRDGITP